MDSFWLQDCALPHYPPLEQDETAQAAVIGGGIAGILCAYFLTKAGVRCVLVEADRICCGTTAHTTAKLTAQHGLLYAQLLRRAGREQAAQVLGANLHALETYRRLCAGLDCDWQKQDAVVFSRRGIGPLEREAAALERLHCPVTLEESAPLPFAVQGALRWPDQAQFHPLKFLRAVLPGLRIYEHTPALALEHGVVRTPGGSIAAEHIIVATHFPFLNKHGSYFLKLYQHRSYVLVLRGGPKLDAMYVDEDKAGYSLRSAGEYLLLGGGGCHTGKPGGWQALEQNAAQWYPQAVQAGRWAAQDCMTLDGVPYIGRYSRRTGNLYVATGFNKWGMTSSMAAAQMLTDLVLGRPNEYAAAFSPSRSMLTPQLAVNAATAVGNLLRPTAPRCPHLGCALRWNAAEHSWDCPCHGSRFGRDGGVLEGPAQRDAQVPAPPEG